MQRIDHIVCRKCGKTYLRKRKEVVNVPMNVVIRGVCPICRVRLVSRMSKRNIRIISVPDRLEEDYHWAYYVEKF